MLVKVDRRMLHFPNIDLGNNRNFLESWSSDFGAGFPLQILSSIYITPKGSSCNPGIPGVEMASLQLNSLHKLNKNQRRHPGILELWFWSWLSGPVWFAPKILDSWNSASEAGLPLHLIDLYLNEETFGKLDLWSGTGFPWTPNKVKLECQGQSCNPAVLGLELLSQAYRIILHI